MRQDNAAPTLKKSYEGEPGKAGAAKDHRTDLLLLVIVRHRDPATTASTSQQQTSRGKPTDTSKKSRLPQPKPHLRHRSTPPSLPQKLQRKHLDVHWSRLPMSSSKDQAPKREYDTKVPPSSDHKDQGFPPELHRRSDLCKRGAAAMQRCLQEGKRQPQPPPSLVGQRAETGSFTQATSTPSSHNNLHRRRQASLHTTVEPSCTRRASTSPRD
jgi:hypothetical protein